MKLSIVVVTMNRAKQLIEALNSCINSIIPENTEFVIIDNASTDDTSYVINSFFTTHKYKYYYERLDENIGCGRGRNYAYLKSHGDYIYFLDDDAYIDLSRNKNFFKDAITILDNNPHVKTLTTQIYDNMWGKNRVDSIGPKLTGELYKIYMFCGGSHFLKRDFFKDANPYYANKYGYEEIFPSLRVYNEGFINAFAPNLLIIHNPIKNKWNEKHDEGIRLAAMGLAQTFLMRFTLFPFFVKPLNILAIFARLLPRMSWKLTAYTTSIIMTTAINKQDQPTLKYSTVLKLFKDFRFSIF